MEKGEGKATHVMGSNSPAMAERKAVVDVGENIISCCSVDWLFLVCLYPSDDAGQGEIDG